MKVAFELESSICVSSWGFCSSEGLLSHRGFSWDMDAKRNRIAIAFDIGFKRRLTLQAHTYENQLIFRV
jgi:hypothetical protein